MSTHHFDTRHAAEYGIPEAVLIRHLAFWITKNRADRRHQHDGRTWTYSSRRALAELFPYLSEKQVRGALERLEEAGVVRTGNYNQRPGDRTLWYAFEDESAFLDAPDHLPPGADAICPQGQTICPPGQSVTRWNPTDGSPGVVVADAHARVADVLESLNPDCAAPAVVAEARAVMDGSHPRFAYTGERFVALRSAALCLGLTGRVPEPVAAALVDLDPVARVALLVAVLRTGATPRTGTRANYLLTLAPSIHAADARRQFTASHGDQPAARRDDRPAGGRPQRGARRRGARR